MDIPCNEIPKIPLKSVTKFRIPISTPSQSKMDAIIMYKQKKSNLASEILGVESAKSTRAASIYIFSAK